MKNSETTLRWLLSAGALYFLAVAIVHMAGIKVPVLFVYYNVPSYDYQDKIISFLTFGWSIFLFTTSLDPIKNRSAVKAILTAGLVAVFGLTVINNVTDFRALSPDIKPFIFKLETFGLAVYVGMLIFCYFIATGQHDKNK
jgi:hypothetical protein